MCVLLYVNLWGQWLSVSLALGSLQNSESLSVFMCAPHPKQEQTCWKWFLSIITPQVYLIWQLFFPLSTFYDVPWISFVAEGTGPDSRPVCEWYCLCCFPFIGATTWPSITAASSLWFWREKQAALDAAYQDELAQSHKQRELWCL